MHRRHDPTYYWATRRLPAEIRPATHALYGYVRTADEIVDGPRRPPSAEARRAALDAWERELERGLAAGRSPNPVVGALVDAGRRHRLPLGELQHLHALDADRLRARADRDLARARGLHGRLGRLGRPHHGPAARRARAPPRRLRAARAGVPARELHPRRARGHEPGPRLPAGRGPRALRRDGGATWAAPTPRPSCARCSRTRSAARARCSPSASPPIAAAPGSVRTGVRFAVGIYLRVLDRVERIDFDVLGRRTGVRAVAGARRRARSAAPVTRRATLRGAERTPLAGDAARADVLVCGASFAGLAVARELAGSGADVLVVDRYELGERQTSACAAPTPWLRRDGRARGDPPGAAVHGVPHAARLRPLPAAVELVLVRLPDALPRAVGAVRTRASRSRRSSAGPGGRRRDGSRRARPPR